MFKLHLVSNLVGNLLFRGFGFRSRLEPFAFDLNLHVHGTLSPKDSPANREPQSPISRTRGSLTLKVEAILMPLIS